MTTEMKRPGGRTGRTRSAVLSAAYEIVSEDGYSGLTVEAVSERSGVHKTTIYRRWGSVESVLFDAVMARAEDAIPLDRTTDTRADLVAMAHSVATNLSDPAAQAVAAAVLSRRADSQLRDLSERFWESRIDAAAQIVSDGQDTGEVDVTIDPRIAIEMIIGPIWFRTVVMQEPVDDGFVESLVDSVV